MKKIITFVLAAFIMFCMVGCNIEDDKTILKLDHKLGTNDEYLTDGQETITEEIEVIKIELTEIEYTKYADGVLPELVSFIHSYYPDVINNNWEYMVHFLDEQQTVATVHFRYLINGEILTDKGIAFSYENGAIDFVVFTNISKTVDEDNIVSRVSLFKDKYTQEEKKLKNDEEFIKETVQYSYDYNCDKLIYTYNLFYYKGQYELRVIDNSTVSEYFIDDNGNAVN